MNQTLRLRENGNDHQRKKALEQIVLEALREKMYKKLFGGNAYLVVGWKGLSC